MTNCDVCGKKLGFTNPATVASINDIEFNLCSACYADVKKVQAVQSIGDERAQAIGKLRATMGSGFSNPDAIAAIEAAIAAGEAQEIKAAESKARWDASMAAIESGMITTSYSFDGYRITGYHGVVTGETALGTGFLSEFGAGLDDIIGAASSTFSEKMTKAKNAAMKALIFEAVKAGGNAIIGVSLSFFSLASNMIAVCASGTPVTVEKIEE